jgi:hypothetical protein
MSVLSIVKKVEVSDNGLFALRFECSHKSVRGGGKSYLHSVNFVILRHYSISNYKFYSNVKDAHAVMGFMHLLNFSQ